jgi:hypothetical protein
MRRVPHVVQQLSYALDGHRIGASFLTQLRFFSSPEHPDWVQSLPIPLSKGHHGISLRVKQTELPANIFI